MVNGTWLDFDEAYSLASKFNVPWVPILARMPYDFNKICDLAEGKTTFPGGNHVREGTVVRPEKERYDHKVGRVCLKWVGCGYLEKSADVPEIELTDASGIF